MEDIGIPSKCIFVRSLPMKCSEQELVALAEQHARPTRVLTMSQKNLGFIEFEDVETAEGFMESQAQKPGEIRGQRVHVKYSDKENLKNCTEVPSIPCAIGDAPSTKKVLLVTLVGATLKATADDIYQIFAQHGVTRISVFSKTPGKQQALIQFSTPTGARTASQLSGVNVAWCTLQLAWSKLSCLESKYSDLNNKEYPNPTMYGFQPQGMSRMVPAPVGVHNHMFMPPFGFVPSAEPFGRTGYAPLEDTGNRVLILNNLPEGQVTPIQLFALFGLYGDIKVVKILYKKRDSAVIEYATSTQASQARLMLQDVQVMGNNISIGFSKMASVNPEKTEIDLCCTPLSAGKCPYNPKNMNPPGSTLHIYNILPDVTKEDLVAVFEEYGHVVSFEFFRSTRKMAYVTYADKDSAISALMSLFRYEMPCTGGQKCTLLLSFAKSSIAAPASQASSVFITP